MPLGLEGIHGGDFLQTFGLGLRLNKTFLQTQKWNLREEGHFVSTGQQQQDQVRCGHAITVLFITQLASVFWVRDLLDSLASFLWHCHSLGTPINLKNVFQISLSFHSQKKKISLSFYSSMIFLGYFILIDKEWNSLLKEEEFLIYFKL